MFGTSHNNKSVYNGLGYLEQCGAKKISFTCITLIKIAKASAATVIVAFSFRAVWAVHFAYVNEPLKPHMITKVAAIALAILGDAAQIFVLHQPR